MVQEQDDNKQLQQIENFVWNIANDELVYVFEKGDYKKIILPFLVLRRLDILLEDTKAAVMSMKAMMDKNNVTNQEPALFAITKHPFCNTSQFTLKTLKATTDPAQLKINTLDYLNGFSRDVQDIIQKLKLRQQVDNLSEVNRLYGIIDKFTDDSINLGINPVLDADGNVLLPGLSNHQMGTVFEHLLRRFNEENQVTEAGEHFTPRDYVKLLAQLAVEPVIDQLEDNTYTVYDGACGTGGILTESKEQILDLAEKNGKKVHVDIFGQELQPDTYATCKADLMIAGDIKSFYYPFSSSERPFIAFGSTISEDGHAGEKYDFCISNPPFGTPWKEDLRKWDLKDKKDIKDPRFVFAYGDEPSYFCVPDIGDPQMLFLANNIARMKNSTKFGTRIVEVHNGSSLFTGKAGGGESNLRRYIIENDLLEAIIQMPENDFYNTGISTYVWILTNRKEERRKGKVQLIDASKISHPLRKNLGSKNCETGEEERKAILQLLMNFKENEQSKIFPNEEFGYWECAIEKPELDEEGNVKKDKKGNIKYKKVKNEVEQIPLRYPGGIEAFYENEVKPYDPEVRFLEPVIGYELSFTKYFYKPVELKSLSELTDLIYNRERRTRGMLDEIFFNKD